MMSVMDRKQMKINFESLPNEIFFECCEYLNGVDIINAFDGLNYRFQILIQSISLHINLEMIRKTTFDHFCNKLLLNPSLKQQIYSLKLSNSPTTCKQIQVFLSFFSLNEFSQLRLLTLNKIYTDNIENIQSMLPLLTHLQYFSFNFQLSARCNLLLALPSLTIQRLSIPELCLNPPIEKIRLITHLTVTDTCILEWLFEVLKPTPMLKYLKINELSISGNESINSLTQAICLTTFIIELKYPPKFSHLEMLLKQTPNLQKFILSTEHANDILDASRWQNIISSSLRHLQIFKFKFIIQFYRYYTLEWILDRFEEFQNDFWHKQHQWFTLYQSNNGYGIISTIPYYSNEFTLMSNTMISSNILVNKKKVFEKVTHLKLNEESMENLSHCYFPNIKSLTLSISILNIRDFESIKRNVNLFNLNSINFEENRQISSLSIILNILKESPNLSSMNIPKQMLFSFFDNSELCQYLKKLIKKLTIRDIHKHPNKFQTIYLGELQQVCKIFSNLEELQCFIYEWNDLIVIFNQLPKLSYVGITSVAISSDDIDRLLEEIKLKINKSFLYEVSKSNQYYTLYLWAGENIN